MENCLFEYHAPCLFQFCTNIWDLHKFNNFLEYLNKLYLGILISKDSKILLY